MTQVKTSSGRYEIQILGKGENGVCRVEHQVDGTVFIGTYAQCLAWLKDRGISAK